MLLVTAFSQAHAEVVDIDNATLQTLLDEGIPIIDVRRSDEWTETGVIENSNLLTFFDAQGGYDAEYWEQGLNAFATSDKPVILICRSGGRSSTISQWLSKKMGYAKVYNVAEGILSWKSQGGAVVSP